MVSGEGAEQIRGTSEEDATEVQNEPAKVPEKNTKEWAYGGGIKGGWNQVKDISYLETPDGVRSTLLAGDDISERQTGRGQFLSVYC